MSTHTVLDRMSQPFGAVTGFFSDPKPENPNLTLTAQFQEQCYLIDNLSSFELDGPSNTIIATRLEHITAVEGNPSDILNIMTKKGSFTDFLSIKPWQLAALVPKIRLYKQLITKNDRTKSYFKEFKFHDFTSNESLENITKTGRGRGQGVGIKSVDYEFVGDNPAIARKNIQVNMSFHFQTLDHLTNRDPINRASYLGLFEGEVDIEGFTDENGKPIHKTQRWVPKAQRFVLNVGWAVPKNVDLGPNSQRLKQAINESQTTITMELQNHSIEFNQDGSIELNCLYRGGIESTLATPEYDVLNTASDVDDVVYSEIAGGYVSTRTAKANLDVDTLERRAENIKTTTKENKDNPKHLGSGTKLSTGGGSFVNSVIEGRGLTGDLLDETEESLEKAKRRRTTITAAEKARKYSFLLSKMIEDDLVYSFDLSHEEVKEWQGGEASKEFNAKVRRALSNPEERKKIKNTMPEEERERFSERLKQKQSAAPGENITLGDSSQLRSSINNVNNDTFKTNKSGNELLSKITSQTTIALPKDSDKVRVNFFYLGDFVDLLTSIVKDNLIFDDVRILLGPILYRKIKGGNSYVNLANIPISLSLFNIWFADHITKKNRAVYMYNTIIRDIIQDLVIPALGADCIQQKGQGQVPEIDFTPLYSRIMTDDGDPIPPWAVVQVNALKGIKFNTSIDPEQARKYKHYMFIHATSYDPDHLSALEKADRDKGIYHIKIGADSGIVKTVEFSRNDDASWETAQQEESGEIGKRNLVKGVYFADIKTVGTTAFIPGSLIYIDPTMIGFGGGSTAREMIKKTGIGGYFRITKVISDLDSSDFETTLKCTFVSFGSDDGSKSPSHAYNDTDGSFSQVPKLGVNPRK